jgi:hypothetical protein
VQIRAVEAVLDRAGVTKAKRVTVSGAAKDVSGDGDSMASFFG